MYQSGINLDISILTLEQELHRVSSPLENLSQGWWNLAWHVEQVSISKMQEG